MVYARTSLLAFMACAWTATSAEETPSAEAPAGVDPGATTGQAEPRYIDSGTVAGRLTAFHLAVAAIPLGKGLEARDEVPLLAARILAGSDVASCLRRWQDIAAAVVKSSRDRLAADPKDNNARNPFEKHALIHGWMACRKKAPFPRALVSSMRDYIAVYKHRQWFGYGALNYRLMNDGAGFIAAEQMPDLVDSDGLDAAAIRAATRQRLFACFDEIVRDNTDEYGAPTYLGIDLSAMKLLADFAQDAEMRQRAAMTLDAMLLQVACAWNAGYYVTPASRAKYFGSSMTGPDSPDTTAGIGWLLFGGLRGVAARHMNPAGSWWFTVPGSYHLPPVIDAIATDRDRPFTHRGSVHDHVRLTIHHQPGWSLASEWTDLSGPSDSHFKESRRTMLKWTSLQAMSTFIPMQDNPRRPYNLKENHANAFGYGENPFTQVLQCDGALIGVTNVPIGYPYWASYAPFTRSGAILTRIERDGWVLCHGGSVLFAFRYLDPAVWAKPRDQEQCDVLRCEARTTGWVLQAASPAAYGGGTTQEVLERFGKAVSAATRIDQSLLHGDRPRLSVHTLSSHDLELDWRPFTEPYDQQQRIDGTPVAYKAFPQNENPWVHQDRGSPLLRLQHGSGTLTYHFDTWSREETPEGSR